MTPRKRLRTENIVNKTINREHYGKFSSRAGGKSDELPFKSIPDRLRFCLRDILPYCYLADHVFMGLTACGQFLMSFTVSFAEEEEEEENYSFTNNYKYKLYFWIYRPNTMLANFYQVCLFDDHGVDNMKTVTMTQWVSNPRLLIVHGASDCESEESYITYVAVPKLGCRDCSEIRKSESDENYKTDTLCIRCNLTIHTKYTRTDSDPPLVSQVNFNHPDYLVTVSNGFIHSLRIELEKPPQQNQFRLFPRSSSTSFFAYQQQQFLMGHNHHHHHHHNHPYAQSPALSQDQTMDEIELNFNATSSGEDLAREKERDTIEDYSRGGGPSTSSPSTTSGIIVATTKQQQQLNKTEQDASTMVANIIADFAECETKATNSEKNRIFSRNDRRSQITANLSQTRAGDNLDCASTSMGSCAVINANLNQHHPNIATPHPPLPQQIPRLPRKEKVDSYEFSEETEERCEKISLFRKKRLADKKYEFSEDNAENIIPFNRMRTTRSSMAAAVAAASGSSSPMSYFEIPAHAHRASPNYGFRSPCGSPIGNRCLRSPPTTMTSFARNTNMMMGRSPTYIVGYPSSSLSPSGSGGGGGGGGVGSGMFSPKHQYYAKRFNNNNSGGGAGVSIPPYVFSSPKRNCCSELQEILPGNFQTNSGPLMPPPQQGQMEVNQSQGAPPAVPDEKPVFSKKVVRRFVEETDAASVITNEEDDCISPGYHTSLPMEVHGSCYSVMQMISAASAQKLNCPIVKITQNSFDMDQFTYFVANHVCEKHNKKYSVFYDWACELVSICKYSGIATCVLAVHFTATDQLAANPVMKRAKTTKAGFFGGGDRGGVTKVDPEPPVQLLLGGGGEKEDASNYDCINCSSNLDCVFHRKHYQCCTLFTWDIATADWTVLDYGELVEMGQKWRNQSTKKQTTILRARTRKMANQLRGGGGTGEEKTIKLKQKTNREGGGRGGGAGMEDEEEGIERMDGHLRVLDSCYAKSKEALTDLRNCVEFYRGAAAVPSAFTDLSDNSSDEAEEVEDEEVEGEASDEED